MGTFDADLPGPGPTETYIPPRVQGYEVRRLLGVGGSATVWLVANTATGTERALKVLAAGPNASLRPCPADSGEAPGVETRRELAILSSCSHVHLIGIHQLLNTDQGPALLMDYAAGGSLAQLVAARGPLPVGEVITLLTPLAHVLAHLHGLGVTHSDVSPGNILFSAEGMPLLSDLGVGRLLGEASAPGQHTPGFAPAKVPSRHFNGRLFPQQSTTASDVYALGAVGWFCLTGRVPATTINRPPLSVLVPGVPESLALLIEAALSEEGADRPKAGEFARLVYGCAQPLPVDLVQSVHPSVLPELRTRRSTQEGTTPLRFRRPTTTGRTRARRPGSLRPHLWVRHVGGSHRTVGRREHASGQRTRPYPAWLMPSIIAGALALAMAVAGLTLGPGIFKGAAMPALSDSPDSAVRGSTEVRTVAPTLVSAQPTTKASAQPTTQETVRASRTQPPAPGIAELVSRTQTKDPAAAVPALAQLRAAAYRSGDAALLRHVNASGSPAMMADQHRLAAMESSGTRLSGLAAEVQQAEPRSGNGQEAAEVAVTVTTSGYVERNDRGDTVRIQAKEQTQRLVLVLCNTGFGWRISDVALP